jgi:signal peptidase I
MRGFRGKQTSTFAQLAKKVVKLCMLGLIGLLLIVAGLQAVLYYAQGGRMLSIQTKSMVPYLQKGELVEVVRVPAKTLKVGDVITYVSPVDNRITLTHRIRFR